MAARLDSEQIETLRAWGAGLATDEREEVRAAGKAITLLVDEIDRLNIDLWNLRAAVERPQPDGEPEPQDGQAAADHSLGAALRDRLRRRASRTEPGV